MLRLALRAAGFERLDLELDLAEVEADGLDVEIEFGAGQRLQSFRERPVVPSRDGAGRGRR